MAQALICDIDPSHGEAAFLVTFIEQAEAQAMCAPCYARAGLEIALAVLPGDEVLARVNGPTPAPANGESPPAKPAGRKRAGTTPAKRRRPAQAVEGVAETPPPAADR